MKIKKLSFEMLKNELTPKEMDYIIAGSGIGGGVDLPSITVSNTGTVIDSWSGPYGSYTDTVYGPRQILLIP